jgi:hypothetical protein
MDVFEKLCLQIEVVIVTAMHTCTYIHALQQTLFLMVARAGERTRDLLISFILPFHHFTAEPQRLPCTNFLLLLTVCTCLANQVEPAAWKICRL